MNTKKALIYNKYLSTAGGGERASFDLALALTRIGYHVIIASDDPLFDGTFSNVTEGFGSYKEIEFKKFDFLNEIIEFSKNSDLDLFVNHTFSCFIPNPLYGKHGKGVYLMMFPYLSSSEQIEALNTYDLILSISEFTKLYVDVYGSQFADLTSEHKTLVLPISDSHLKASSEDNFNKEKLIINIGRFNVRGHNKCQLDVIKFFKHLRQNNIIDDQWSLICAGQLNKTPENLLYYDSCIEESEGYNIKVLSDISLDKMTSLYKRASVLIQMTGFDRPFGYEPELCEHLGLVALDCFAYGVIPVCYQRSGISGIINHGIDGFLFDDLDEAGAYISVIDREFNKKFHLSMIEQTQVVKSFNTFEQYQNMLSNILERNI